jgi:hypothetical protein
MAKPLLDDDLYRRHAEARGVDEHGNLKPPERLTPDERRTLANQAIAELEGGYSEADAAKRSEQLTQAQAWLDNESGDNSLTSSSLWRRVDVDTATRQSKADEVADWLGI